METLPLDQARCLFAIKVFISGVIHGLSLESVLTRLSGRGRLDNLVDGVRKRDKLIITGLGVKQWRPINLAQLFPHYSPIGRFARPSRSGKISDCDLRTTRMESELSNYDRRN